jgi:hypothetical protein
VQKSDNIGSWFSYLGLSLGLFHQEGKLVLGLLFQPLLFFLLLDLLGLMGKYWGVMINTWYIIIIIIIMNEWTREKKNEWNTQEWKKNVKKNGGKRERKERRKMKMKVIYLKIGAWNGVQGRLFRGRSFLAKLLHLRGGPPEYGTSMVWCKEENETLIRKMRNPHLSLGSLSLVSLESLASKYCSIRNARPSGSHLLRYHTKWVRNHEDGLIS